jgi:hypothetical protein
MWRISMRCEDAEDGAHCMHKVHRSYKYTGQRRDGAVVVVGVAMVIVVVSDGGVKKVVECSS